MTPVVQYFKCTKKCTKVFTLKWSGKDFILIISSNYWKFWLTTSKEIEKLKEIGRKSFQNWYIKIIWFFIVKYFGEYWKNFFLASHDHQRIQSFCHKFEKSSVNSNFFLMFPTLIATPNRNRMHSLSFPIRGGESLNCVKC